MIIFIVLAVAINTFIIVEAAMSGESSTTQSSWLADLIVKIFHVVPSDDFIYWIRKLIGHLGLYLVDGVLTSLAEYYFFMFKNSFRDRNYMITVIVSGIVLSSISELIQLMAFNRSFAFTDMLINLAGYVFGSGVTYLILYLVNKKKAKASE